MKFSPPGGFASARSYDVPGGHLDFGDAQEIQLKMHSNEARTYLLTMYDHNGDNGGYWSQEFKPPKVGDQMLGTMKVGLISSIGSREMVVRKGIYLFLLG